MKISKYQIFGERNSGTNYLDKVMQYNLALEATSEFGYKHWFIKNHYPRGSKNTTTDNECLTPITRSKDTLFIYIVREPISWLQSMHRSPWHAPEHIGLSFGDFIRNPWNCYEQNLPIDHGPDSLTPWQRSSNGKYLIENAKNICALRNIKNEHFLSLEGDVNYFFIIRQNHLLEDLEIMVEKFKFSKKHPTIELPDYRSPIAASEISLDDLAFIQKQLDYRLETLLGFEESLGYAQRISNF